MAQDLKSSLKFEPQEVVDCSKKVVVTLDADSVKREANNATRDFANYVNIPGFRKGKAPVAMLKQRYATDIKQELERRIITTAIGELLQDKDMDILNYSLEENPEISFDKEIKATIVLDLAPEFQLPEYRNLEVEYEKNVVADDVVDERLNLYRSMYANYIDITDGAKAEDMLKVNYTSDFVLAEDASAYLKRQVEAENNFIWLKEPESIPGSIAALTGAKVDDEVEIKAEYPADFREEALAGKTVNYKVKVLNVQRRGELTDAELCEKVQAASIEEFKANLKLSLENEAAGANQQKLMDAVGDKIDSLVEEFTLPEAFVKSETSREIQKIAEQSVKSEEDAEAFKKDLDKHKAAAEEIAKKAIRRKLILRKIAHIESINVSNEEIDAQINAMSGYYNYKPGELRAMLMKNGGMDELQFSMINAKVLQFLADNVKK